MTNRRRFLAAALGAAVRHSSEELPLAELQGGLRAGRLTARSLAEHCVARIGGIDKHGPAVNSVIELDPDALALAGALDRSVAAADVPVVRRLCAAGAVIPGEKPTGANGPILSRPTPPAAGAPAASRPAIRTHSIAAPGAGSGSPVAVRRSLPGGRGHRDGQLRRLLFVRDGIVGIKPTVGVLSGAGIIPFRTARNPAVPMARTVRDAALPPRRF